MNHFRLREPDNELLHLHATIDSFEVLSSFEANGASSRSLRRPSHEMMRRHCPVAAPSSTQAFPPGMHSARDVLCVSTSAVPSAEATSPQYSPPPPSSVIISRS